MIATITVVQSRTVQSDSECVFHGYGTPLDISAEDVCFYVSFHHCVSPCPGELPGPGGKAEVRHPQLRIERAQSRDVETSPKGLCRKTGHRCKEGEKQSRACEKIAASVVLVAQRTAV